MQFASTRSLRPRAAYTLIELLLVVGIGIVLLGLTSAAVLRVYRTGREGLERRHWANMHQLGKPASRTAPLRVLFVGNSYTQVNSLPEMLATLVNQSPTSPRLEYEAHLVGGATLQQHWEEGVALQLIQKGGWDFVVLQEQSMRPVLQRPAMYTYARLFDQAIRAQGAIPLYYLTWARQAIPEMQGYLNLAYLGIARETRAEVAAVGMAWEKALQGMPGLVLHDSDGSHPNGKGTYLAACVFYAALYCKSPEGLSPSVQVAGSTQVALAPAEALSFQRFAWKAHQEAWTKLHPEWTP